MENNEFYSKTCKKIGFAMLLFYAFFTLSAFGVAVVSVILEKLMSAFAAEVIYEVLSAIVYFFSFFAAAMILKHTCKGLPNERPIYKSFKFDKWAIMLIVAAIAINYALSYLNTSLISSLFPNISFDLFYKVSDLEGRKTFEVVTLFIIQILSTAIVPAVCEEILFRGAILSNLMPFGKSTAIFASAFLFGLMHQNPMQLLYTTLLGVVIGYIYVKTRSIWICMLLHFVNNLLTVLEEFLPVLLGVTWPVILINFAVIIGGGISIVLLLKKKSKAPDPQFDGSFGRVDESGMDYEELPLQLSRGEKLKRFFSVTVIVYTAICIFSMAQSVFSYFNLWFLTGAR